MCGVTNLSEYPQLIVRSFSNFCKGQIVFHSNEYSPSIC